MLRSAYLATPPAEREGLAVNLSSRRVRLALDLIEGMRNGQGLAALLGYRLERGLHDAHGLAEVDSLIYCLRAAFPLRANKLDESAVDLDSSDPAAVGLVEARNVVDGLKLLEHVKTSRNANYPFGLDLPAASAPQRQAVDLEVEHLIDGFDALADVVLAEAVHQSVLGNYDRVSANLNAYSQGELPPEPEVVRTPGAGTRWLASQVRRARPWRR